MDRSVQLEERQILDIEIRPSTGEDSVYLAQHLREADKAEVMASCGSGPLEAVESSRLASKSCFTVLFKGNPALIFGVLDMPDDPKIGCIWMLGTDAVDKFRKRFVRHSSAYLKDVCAGYDLVTNFVDERHVESIRWLKYIGAQFIHRHPQYGVEQRPFLEFILICADLSKQSTLLLK